MQFSSVFPLEGKACMSMSPVRRGGEGSWSERMRIGNCCSTRHNKALRGMCFGARGVVSRAQCMLTSDASLDTLVSFILSIIVLVFHQCPLSYFWFDVTCYNSQFLDAKTHRSSEHPFGGIMLILMKLLLSFCVVVLDPNEVTAVIFGSGTGTQLFPLTSTRANPVVRWHTLLASSCKKYQFN
jgi:hypothetical protein